MQVPGKGWRMGERREPWLRGPTTLEDGWVQVDAARAEEWTPRYRGDRVGPGDPVVELAAVRTPDDARAFAERFGLLYAWPGWPDKPTGPWRQHWDQWDRNAAVLRLVLGLYEDVRAAMAGTTAQDDVRAKWQAVVQEGFPGRTWATDQEFVRDAAVAVADLVSGFLEGTDERLGVLAGDGGTPVMWVFDPRTPDLLTTIYHQVALLVTASAPLRSCSDPKCGRWFTLSDPRQRYCTRAHADRVRQRRQQKEATE